MSNTAAEITRLQTARNTLRTTGVGLGIATNTDRLDALAAAFSQIENRGAVSAQVQEGDTYTIPRGYHNGAGTVSGVSGGGNYKLQSKTATPVKSQLSVTPDSGYYGLSDVTVAPIPDAYQDVSSVTATAPDVLANSVFVTASGKVTTGTMPKIGDVTQVLDNDTSKYYIPKGYHSGSGVVSINTKAVTLTPTKKSQTEYAAQGEVYTKVVVDAIPDAYQDVTGVTATASQVLSGASFVDTTGALLKGSMPNNGSISGTVDGLTLTSYAVPAGYTTGGTVSLTDDIEQALAAI